MAPKKKIMSDSNFVVMEKNGEQIEVHPMAVENHKSLGWTVVGGDQVNVEPENEAESEETAE